jgi:hypothetical protein
LRERDPAPSWQTTFVVAFTGVRGAVSLAAALALPLALPGGEGFPYRDMILFVAFGVIFITLVGLGRAWLSWCDGWGSPGTAARSMWRSMKRRSRRGARRSMRR